MSIRFAVVAGFALALSFTSPGSASLPLSSGHASVSEPSRNMCSLVGGACPVMVALYTDAQYEKLKEIFKVFRPKHGESSKKTYALQDAYDKVVKDPASTPQQIQDAYMALVKQEAENESLEHDLFFDIQKQLTPEQLADFKVKYPRTCEFISLEMPVKPFQQPGIDALVIPDAQYETVIGPLRKAQAEQKALEAKSAAGQLEYAKLYEQPGVDIAQLEQAFQAFHQADYEALLARRAIDVQAANVLDEGQKKAADVLHKRIRDYFGLFSASSPNPDPSLRNNSIFLTATAGRVMSTLLTDAQFTQVKGMAKTYKGEKKQPAQAASKARNAFYKALGNAASSTENLKTLHTAYVNASFEVEKLDFKLENDIKNLLSEEAKQALPGLTSRVNDYDKLYKNIYMRQAVDTRAITPESSVALVYTDAELEAAKKLLREHNAVLRAMRKDIQEKQAAFDAAYANPDAQFEELEKKYLALYSAKFPYDAAMKKRNQEVAALQTEEVKQKVKTLCVRIAAYSQLFGY